MFFPESYSLFHIKGIFGVTIVFLLLVYTIHLSLRTNLVDPPPMGTIYMKHPLSGIPDFNIDVFFWSKVKIGFVIDSTQNVSFCSFYEVDRSFYEVDRSLYKVDRSLYEVTISINYLMFNIVCFSYFSLWGG